MVFRLVQRTLIVACALVACQSMAPRVAWAEPNWDQPVRNLDVADFRGRVWTMGDFRDADLIVVAFLGTECPLAKL